MRDLEGAGVGGEVAEEVDGSVFSVGAGGICFEREELEGRGAHIKDELVSHSCIGSV